MIEFKPGFTLLELMIALAILAVAIAVAWPSLSKQIERSEEEKFNLKIQQTIDHARYKAINLGKPVLIIVDKEKIEAVPLDDVWNCDTLGKRKIWIRADGSIDL